MTRNPGLAWPPTAEFGKNDRFSSVSTGGLSKSCICSDASKVAFLRGFLHCERGVLIHAALRHVCLIPASSFRWPNPQMPRVIVGVALTLCKATVGRRTQAVNVARFVVKGCLQVIILLLTGQWHGSGLVHLLAVLLEQLLVDLGGGGSESGSSDEFLGTD